MSKSAEKSYGRYPMKHNIKTPLFDETDFHQKEEFFYVL